MAVARLLVLIAEKKCKTRCMPRNDRAPCGYRGPVRIFCVRWLSPWRHSPSSPTTPLKRSGCMIAWFMAALHSLVHHSERGVLYVSIRYGERLAEAGIKSSVGIGGGSCDNALAESVIGIYKTEMIRRRGPWRNLEDVEISNAGMDGLV